MLTIKLDQGEMRQYMVTVYLNGTAVSEIESDHAENIADWLSSNFPITNRTRVVYEGLTGVQAQEMNRALEYAVPEWH